MDMSSNFFLIVKMDQFQFVISKVVNKLLGDVCCTTYSLLPYLIWFLISSWEIIRGALVNIINTSLFKGENIKTLLKKPIVYFSEL